jgi:hypothetical protein
MSVQPITSQVNGGPSAIQGDAAANPQHTIAALRYLLVPGQVVELRAVDATLPGRPNWPRTYSGYFNDSVLLAEHAHSVIASGTYFTLNLINPALLSRAANRARMIYGREPTTGDGDVLARLWLEAEVVQPFRDATVEGDFVPGKSQALEQVA